MPRPQPETQASSSLPPSPALTVAPSTPKPPTMTAQSSQHQQHLLSFHNYLNRSSLPSLQASAFEPPLISSAKSSAGSPSISSSRLLSVGSRFSKVWKYTVL